VTVYQARTRGGGGGPTKNHKKGQKVHLFAILSIKRSNILRKFDQKSHFSVIGPKVFKKSKKRTIFRGFIGPLFTKNLRKRPF